MLNYFFFFFFQNIILFKKCHNFSTFVFFYPTCNKYNLPHAHTFSECNNNAIINMGKDSNCFSYIIKHYIIGKVKYIYTYHSKDTKCYFNSRTGI
ncbi:hypothetical protein [Plasmodium yoelii yoelii]|uniref:Uncharacterized protein n=1 Tax=Plasmodium yoelii yoelii TaxID=73239 RepID=Q7RIH5_PLAYO|nr:hypothetical protein [Plasmodium yoelii yoelii]